jgi:hypothetical protein
MSDRKQPLGRRTMLAGAGTVGALAAAAAALPLVQHQAPADAKAKPGAQQPLDTDGGYRLTEHVKRYYRSTRI